MWNRGNSQIGRAIDGISRLRVGLGSLGYVHRSRFGRVGSHLKVDIRLSKTKKKQKVRRV